MVASSRRPKRSKVIGGSTGEAVSNTFDAFIRAVTGLRHWLVLGRAKFALQQSCQVARPVHVPGTFSCVDLDLTELGDRPQLPVVSAQILVQFGVRDNWRAGLKPVGFIRKLFP